MNTKFNIDDIVWDTRGMQWKITHRASALESEPPVKWKCGRTNDSNVWDEQVFNENDLSGNEPVKSIRVSF